MKKLLILLAGLLLFSVGTASAFPLFPGSGTSAGTQFEDSNFDYFYDLNGDTKINGNIYDPITGELTQEGDVLYAAVEFDNARDLIGGGGAVGLDLANDDLKAWTTIQIKDIEVVSYGGVFATIYRMGQYGDTPMVEFYTGGDLNVDVLNLDTDTNNPTLAEAEAAVKQGATHLWSFSITDDVDTFWVFKVAHPSAGSPDDVKQESVNQEIGTLSYALNQVDGKDIFNALYFEANPLYGIPVGDNLVDLTGNGSIYGAGWDPNGDKEEPNYFALSDIDVAVNPIPEPATMTLFGMSLLGLAFVGRRRK